MQICWLLLTSTNSERAPGCSPLLLFPSSAEIKLSFCGGPCSRTCPSAHVIKHNLLSSRINEPNCCERTFLLIDFSDDTYRAQGLKTWLVNLSNTAAEMLFSLFYPPISNFSQLVSSSLPLCLAHLLLPLGILISAELTWSVFPWHGGRTSRRGYQSVF